VLGQQSHVLDHGVHIERELGVGLRGVATFERRLNDDTFAGFGLASAALLSVRESGLADVQHRL
jgi:hypothetical protein